MKMCVNEMEYPEIDGKIHWGVCFHCPTAIAINLAKEEGISWLHRCCPRVVVVDE